MSQENKTIEGFGCRKSRENMNRFLTILLVVAILAYFASSRRMRVYDLGIASAVSMAPRPIDIRQFMG